MDLSTPMPSIRAMAELATPMAIRVAATLSLVERAGGSGATAEQLASETATSAQALQRSLDHLVCVGVFELDAVVRPLPAHETRRPDERGRPGGDQTPARHQQRRGRADLAFVELLGTITTGAPAYPHRYGRDFWADLDADPKLRRSFDAQMNWRFQVQAPQIAERFDWSRFSQILDVGGGDGTLLAAILQAHPGVRAQVLELAPTATAAADRFAAAGVDDRADAVAGSFFDLLPAGADAYLLSDILHDWDDAHARQILAGCRRGPRRTGPWWWSSRCTGRA